MKPSLIENPFYYRCLRLATLALAFSIASSGIAAPSDELSHAVKRTGSTSVEQAQPAEFLLAFNSVVIRHKRRDLPAYVGAAVKLWPDLAGQIVVAAIILPEVGKNVVDKNVIDKQISCETINPIVREAVTAAPEETTEIVRAVVAAAPQARDCIVTAAIAAAPDQEFAIRRAAGEGESIAFLAHAMAGNINPVNFIAQESVTSPEQPPSGP